MYEYAKSVYWQEVMSVKTKKPMHEMRVLDAAFRK